MSDESTMPAELQDMLMPVQFARDHRAAFWRALGLDELVLPFACDGCHGRGFHVVQMPGVLGGMQTRPVPCQACAATGRRDRQGEAWGMPDRFKEGGEPVPTSDEFADIGLRAAAAAREPVVYTNPELCSHRWKTGDTSCRTWDHVCILNPGHEGPHHSQLGRDQA